MRIVSGTLSGRIISGPVGNRTHPMSEKIRGALFSTLGDIEGLSVLDAFAGTGAIGLEAVSRGATKVLLIEKDKTAQDCIQKNINNLNVNEAAKLVQTNASSWSSNNSNEVFDIVVLDPPYTDIKLELLDKLTSHTKKDGILVLSLPPNANFLASEDFEFIKQKNYGDSSLVFYKRIR